MQVLTKHYTRYENSKEVEWSVEVHEGQGIFHNKFLFQGKNYEAQYDDNAILIREKLYYGENEVPKPITDLLDYRIVKYKIDSFFRLTHFNPQLDDVIEYRVEAKTKTGASVVYWFDNEFNLLPDKED